MSAVDSFNSGLLTVYNAFVSTLPNWGQDFVNLFFLVLLIVIYSIFIWKFYRFIAKKNILGLNLGKYSGEEHSFLAKFFAGVLYFIEYVIILPFLIFFWFAIFTLFLILLTEGIAIENLLIISATIIAAVRMTSYIPHYGEELAKEISKLLPFTLLALTITKPGFFDFQRILTQFANLPGFFGQILTYLAFIILLEVLLRFFDLIFLAFGIEDVPELKEEEEEQVEGKK